METKIVLQVYCNPCIYRKECYIPCVTVLQALYSVYNLLKGEGENDTKRSF